MPTLNPNIMFKGNCEEAFDFYQTIFGGEMSPKMRWGDNKMQDLTVPESALRSIMHVSLPIGNESILMGSDIVENSPYPTTFGNNFTICISANSKE